MKADGRGWFWRNKGVAFSGVGRSLLEAEQTEGDF